MKLCLRIMNAPEGVFERTLEPPGGLLGRSTESTIHLPYDSVSRQHVELQHDGKAWWLHNRSQTSPTLLDSQLVPIGQPKALGPSGTMTLGRVILEFRQESHVDAPTERRLPLNAEATLIMPRPVQAPVVPAAILAQMTPVRAGEPPPLPPLSAPPTIIRRAPTPPAVTPPVAEAPATMIRVPRPAQVAEAAPQAAVRSHFEAPQTIVRRRADIVPQPAPAAPLLRPEPSEVLEVAEHDLQPIVDSEAQNQAELESLRKELAAAQTANAALKRENESLRDAKATIAAQLEVLRAEVPPSTPPSTETPRANIALLQEKALELLASFGGVLQQASDALGEGNPIQARALLRKVSFGLADLRDLFQS